jgi:hypothetical protein
MDLRKAMQNQNSDQTQNTLTLPGGPEACCFHGNEVSGRISVRIFSTRFTDPYNLQSFGMKAARSTNLLPLLPYHTIRRHIPTIPTTRNDTCTNTSYVLPTYAMHNLLQSENIRRPRRFGKL